MTSRRSQGYMYWYMCECYVTYLLVIIKTDKDVQNKEQPTTTKLEVLKHNITLSPFHVQLKQEKNIDASIVIYIYKQDCLCLSLSQSQCIRIVFKLQS